MILNQSFSSGNHKYPVLESDNDELVVSKPFRKLYPIFITPSTYLLGIMIPNSVVPSRVRTTHYKSMINPKQGCPYLAWSQVNPNDGADTGLSWLIIETSGPDPREVIQLLTSQLTYTVRWKLTLTKKLKNPNPVTFILPGQDVGYEAPDIKGDKIVFDLPGRVGESTRGCFKIPGQYGQFVIAANRNVEMELWVTGKVTPIDVYSAPNEFYVDVCGNEVLAYTNIISDVRTATITRIVSPELASLEQLFLAEFHSNPFYPCFPSTPFASRLKSNQLKGPPLPVTVNAQSSYGDPQNTVLLGLTIDCGTFYSNPSIPLGNLNYDSGPNIYIASGGADLSQFMLRGGTLYKMRLSLSGTAPISLQSGVPTVACSNAMVAMLYSVGDKAPVSFDPLLSVPNPDDFPPFGPTELAFQVRTTPASGVLLLSIESTPFFYYVFATSGFNEQFIPYAFRVNSLLFNYDLGVQMAGGSYNIEMSVELYTGP